jgi:hypothetical protein
MSARRFTPLNNQGLKQLFCLEDATIGADPTGVKCLGINHLGWFEMRNSDNDDIFVVTEAGIPVFPKADRIVFGGPTANTTLIFPTPAASIGLTFPQTGDTMVGTNTAATLVNKGIDCLANTCSNFQAGVSGGFSGTITAVIAVTSTTQTIQYKDWASANQTATLVNSVNATTRNLVFINGILQP